jgi:hypothetical protein
LHGHGDDTEKITHGNLAGEMSAAENTVNLRVIIRRHQTGAFNIVDAAKQVTRFDCGASPFLATVIGIIIEPQPELSCECGSLRKPCWGFQGQYTYILEA